MEDWSKKDKTFRYMMLDRLRQDCDYSLNYCDGSANVLWAKDAKSQIENMLALWETFDPEDRPEWLTWDDLCDYARRMSVEIKVELTAVHYFRKNRDDEGDVTND